LRKSARARCELNERRNTGREATAAFKLAREQFFGSQGAASPVRMIDPKTGEVIVAAKPD
jgi:hypothetical protein